MALIELVNKKRFVLCQVSANMLDKQVVLMFKETKNSLHIYI